MLNELAKEIHENAKDKGWWDEERSFGEIIALCHAELSEALEEHRDGRQPNETYFICKYERERPECFDCGVEEGSEECKDRSPEGIPTELADTIIRILDYCGRKSIDIEEAIKDKMKFNSKRSYKHGGKLI